MNYRVELPKYGDAAGDGKGELLRNATIMYNNSIMAIVDWISGAPTINNLTNVALDISRGGTGAQTAHRARLNLGLFVTNNNELVYGSKGISLYDGTTLDHDGTVKPIYKKIGIGHYELGNVAGFGLTGFKYVLPKDSLGNILCGCDITFTDGKADVLVYAVKLEAGLIVLDKSKPMDIPTGRAIDISVK